MPLSDFLSDFSENYKKQDNDFFVIDLSGDPRKSEKKEEKKQDNVWTFDLKINLVPKVDITLPGMDIEKPSLDMPQKPEGKPGMERPETEKPGTGTEKDLSKLKNMVKQVREEDTKGKKSDGSNKKSHPPCSYCVNYNDEEDSCKRGLNTKKVQSARSCSWLNSSFSSISDD